ncbi:unnamed protein product [Pedinophyceae sp. YPF-701]|nr:unnamed protein product [Pedinophyceae sp. YPF-701]
MKTKARSCKLYWGLTFIAYLEVVLWTTCLLSSCVNQGAPGSAEDFGYLQRETVNLKAGYTGLLKVSLPVDVNFRGFDLHTQLEHRAWKRIAEAHQGTAADEEYRQGLELALLPVSKGTPAPYAGINAID